jgi:prevent-host-death family protein
MDKTITTEDFRNQPDNILKDVQGGESFTVTSGGKPVARIVPAEAADDETARKDAAWTALLARLDQQPALNLGPWSREDGYL